MRKGVGTRCIVFVRWAERGKARRGGWREAAATPWQEPRRNRQTAPRAPCGTGLAGANLVEHEHRRAFKSSTESSGSNQEQAERGDERATHATLEGGGRGTPAAEDTRRHRHERDWGVGRRPLATASRVRSSSSLMTEVMLPRIAAGVRPGATLSTRRCGATGCAARPERTRHSGRSPQSPASCPAPQRP